MRIKTRSAIRAIWVTAALIIAYWAYQLVFVSELVAGDDLALTNAMIAGFVGILLVFALLLMFYLAWTTKTRDMRESAYTDALEAVKEEHTCEMNGLKAAHALALETSETEHAEAMRTLTAAHAEERARLGTEHERLMREHGEARYSEGHTAGRSAVARAFVHAAGEERIIHAGTETSLLELMKQCIDALQQEARQPHAVQETDAEPSFSGTLRGSPADSASIPDRPPA